MIVPRWRVSLMPSRMPPARASRLPTSIRDIPARSRLKRPSSAASPWKLSNCPKPSAAACRCPDVGWSNALSAGQRDADGWLRTMNDTPGTLAGLDVVAFVCFMLRRAALPAAGCITPSRARARMQCAANAGRSVGTTGGQTRAAPCASMLTATSTITGMNSLRTHALGMRTSTLAPIIAPSSTPSATGAAIVGSMSPR